MEKLSGITLSDLISKHNLYVKEFIRLHRSILGLQTNNLRDFSYVLLEEKMQEKYFSIRRIKNNFCHGSYTTKNVMFYKNGFYVIDFEGSFKGDPIIDICITFIILNFKAKFEHNYKVFLDEYLKILNDFSKKDFEAYLPICASYLRSHFNFPEGIKYINSF